MGRLLSISLLVLAATGAGAQDYQPPHTSWGEPDLQGTWANDNEYATPLERPAEFAGKTLADITPEDLAEVRRKATENMIAHLAPGPRGPDQWWLENLDLTKRAQPWLIVDPPDGKIPALTPDAQARHAGPGRSSFQGGKFDSPKDFGPLDRCISRGLPGSMIPVMYGNVYGIFQSPGFVTITYEIIHEARVIPIDGGPHVGAPIQMHMGDARGHWEGDTLVVETTNFNPLTVYRGANPAKLKLTERYRRVAEDKIAWSVTMDDPTTWTAPWTIAMPLTSEKQPSLPFECHEGNFGLRNILSAARANEAKQKQQQQKKK
jgi:hypothetical protein